MRVSDKAIVLHSIRHGDKKFILKIYTYNHGLLTVAVRVGTTSQSKLRSSVVLPLSLLDVELIIKQNKEIHQLTEARHYYVTGNFSSSVQKLSIVQFINEVVNRSIKEQNANRYLYE